MQYGTLLINVALLIDLASLILCFLFPPPVLITKDILSEFKTSTICGLPELSLLIFLHFIPFFLITSDVPFVPDNVNPNLVNLWAIPTISCL